MPLLECCSRGDKISFRGAFSIYNADHYFLLLSLWVRGEAKFVFLGGRRPSGPPYLRSWAFMFKPISII